MAVDAAQAVDPDLHVARGGDLGVQLPDAPGTSVPGVGVKRLAPFSPLLIEASERLQGHIHLAPDFQTERRLSQQSNRDTADGAEVLGHILPHLPVAPGCSLGQQPVFVGQVHCKSIDLQLAHQVEVGIVQETLGAAVPGLQFFHIEGVAQAEHGHGVLYLGEPFRRPGAYSLSGRVRANQLRVRFLQPAQLAHQSVVVTVADHRVVQHVVPVVMVVKFLAQPHRALVDVVINHSFRRSAKGYHPGI